MRIRYLGKTEEVLKTSPWVMKNPEAWKGRWKSICGEEKQKIYLEIGCGKGKFICQMAAENPDTLLIGDERVSTILARAALRAANEAKEAIETSEPKEPHEAHEAHEAHKAHESHKAHEPHEAREAYDQSIGQNLNLSNLRLIRVSAEELEKVFEPGEIDRIYLTFSDPWPKEKHAKRRLTSERFLPIYQRLLGTKGDLCFKTDNDGLFDYSLRSLSANGWTILEITDDLHGTNDVLNPSQADEAGELPQNRGQESFDFKKQQSFTDPGVLVTTEYEENFIHIGKNIHYLRAIPPRVQ